jgi:hypothetical protein
MFKEIIAMIPCNLVNKRDFYDAFSLPSSLGVAPFLSRHPWAECNDEPRIQGMKAMFFYSQSNRTIIKEKHSHPSVIARYEAIQDNKGAMFCLCLRQSG